MLTIEIFNFPSLAYLRQAGLINLTPRSVFLQIETLTNRKWSGGTQTMGENL